MSMRRKIRWLQLLPLVAINVALIYFVSRTVLLFLQDYHWYEYVVAVLLLLAESFLLLHGCGYMLSIIRATGQANPIDLDQKPKSFPPLAVVVASYKEPLNVLEETLACFNALSYPNKYLYLLDDTRYADHPDDEALQRYKKQVEELCECMEVNLFRHKWHDAKAGLINDFLLHQAVNPREGSVLKIFQRAPPLGGEKYIAIFDADQNPMPGFAEPIIAHMEMEYRLAFIQTPQYYTNISTNTVAHAAGLQQAIFYEFICEGKGAHDAMMCCGTNVVFRNDALLDIGGFEEHSVTEDFATSLRLHLNEWSSRYFPRVCAFGLGPEDLSGYFKQQYRWALGSVGVFKEIAHNFSEYARYLPVTHWVEYFLAGTYYFIGFVYLIMGACPILYLLLGVPSYFAKPEIYFLTFIPYFFLTMITFYVTLGRRNYRIRDILLGQILTVNSAPVYVRAVIDALLNRKKPFEVTPKGQSNSIPLSRLKLYLFCGALNLAAMIWGLLQMYFSPERAQPILVNVLWATYHFVIINFIFYFNNPIKVKKS
ncbi:MAG: glycosyltransferase [Pontiellaceae bacterium]|nr:glycosyltransferase [Pontiellaceae bacterium]